MVIYAHTSGNGVKFGELRRDERTLKMHRLTEQRKVVAHAGITAVPAGRTAHILQWEHPGIVKPIRYRDNGRPGLGNVLYKSENGLGGKILRSLQKMRQTASGDHVVFQQQTARLYRPHQVWKMNLFTHILPSFLQTKRNNMVLSYNMHVMLSI